MTATEPSISPGPRWPSDGRVIAYPLGECSNEAAMASTKARTGVGCGWPFLFAWRSPCPRGHFSHRISQPRSFQPPQTRRSSEMPCCALLNLSGRRALFNKSFYNRLSMCFGHIAHYVEGVIMRSASVNTPQILSSTTNSLCIFPTALLSAASQLPDRRSPYRNGLQSRRSVRALAGFASIQSAFLASARF